MAKIPFLEIVELIIAGEVLRFKDALRTLGDDEETKIDIIETVLSHDHIEAFQALLDSEYLDLERYRSRKGLSVLHLAVLQDCLRVIDYIAYSAPSPELINAQTQFGETILHLVAALGNLGLIRLIFALFKNIDLTLRDKYDRTASDVAIETGNSHLIGPDLLPQTAPKIVSYVSSLPPTKSQLITDFMSELSRRTADLELKQPIQVTVKNTFSVTVDNLAAVANNNVLSSSNNSVVFTATTTAYSAKVVAGIPLSKMMEYPGDLILLRTLPLPRSDNSRSDGVYYDVNGKDSFGLAAIHKACAWHQLNVLTYLLGIDQVDVNIAAATNVYMAFTPLHMAVESGFLPAVQLLLSDPRLERNKEDSHHRTPLQYAQEKNLLPFIELLSAP